MIIIYMYRRTAPGRENPAGGVDYYLRISDCTREFLNLPLLASELWVLDGRWWALPAKRWIQSEWKRWRDLWRSELQLETDCPARRLIICPIRIRSNRLCRKRRNSPPDRDRRRRHRPSNSDSFHHRRIRILPFLPFLLHRYEFESRPCWRSSRPRSPSSTTPLPTSPR